MYRDMPKMSMNLQRPQSVTQHQHKAFLYNTYANKAKLPNAIAPASASVKKPVSASLSKMTMVGRIQGIKSGCNSCGK
jgi:hypothetical protein